MSDTLAKKISDLSAISGCPVDFNLDLGTQADDLTKKDQITLKRFGNDFKVPEKEDLPSH